MHEWSRQLFAGFLLSVYGINAHRLWKKTILASLPPFGRSVFYEWDDKAGYCGSVKRGYGIIVIILCHEHWVP
jgi:hypothetical protein